MKSRKILLILLCCILSSSLEATQYLGLGSEPGQGKEQRKVQIIDGYLYVPTSNGLFRKSVSTLNDTIWELYGFKGIPVRDFVKKNDSIIAITTRKNDNLMMLSTDNGKTFIDYTSDYFKVPGVTASINLIASNPLNKNSLLLSAPAKGLLKSTDFGKTWKTIASIGSLRFTGYNLADTTSIYGAGILPIDMPFLWVSFDVGNNWSTSDIIDKQSVAISEIFFYPDIVNDMLIGVDNWICKSNDKGKTWHKADKLDITDLCFAVNAKNKMLYVTGRSFDGKIKVLTSVSYDGEFWFLIHNKPINDLSSAYDIHLVGNDVLLFTERGVYNISAQKTSLNEVTLDVSVVQNGTTVSFKGTEIIESVRIYNISGKLMKTIHPKSNKHTIDISSFQKGLYIFEFGGKESLIKKKILIM